MKYLAAILCVCLTAAASQPVAARDHDAEHDKTHYGTYINGPWGQIHVRIDGKVGDPAVILLHSFPGSSLQFRFAQPLLARLGFRSIAVDIPGMGWSDPPPSAPAVIPSAREFAEIILPVLDEFGIRSATLVGTNTGASLVVAFALAHPERVDRIILDGPPVFTPAQRVDLIAKNRPTDPHSPATEWYAHDAIFRYDLESALRQLKGPVDIIAYPGQVLNKASLAVKAMRPDFGFKTLTSTDPTGALDQPEQWTRVVGEFMQGR